MGNVGPSQLLIIGVVIIILFGASRLPATAKGLGQALRIFKKEVRDDEKPNADATTAESSTGAAEPDENTSTEAISSTPSEPPATQSADETKRAES